MAKIKQGDMVIVRAGGSRGLKGKVLDLLPGDKVVVEGVNLRKKMMRSKVDKKAKAELVEKPYPLHISNVGILDTKSGQATRVGYSVEKGKKVRIAKKSGTTI
ncbi:MAG: 50S ribosomal protein L24 [Candidatus Pacebacteria bacterium]|nr:50S ribosomal protein L24 [Candidatus Paceibacterota bacterium]